MVKTKQCAICGTTKGCGKMIMDQYICLDCQVLIDDPNRRVFGCPKNRRFAKRRTETDLELVKARQ